MPQGEAKTAKMHRLAEDTLAQLLADKEEADRKRERAEVLGIGLGLCVRSAKRAVGLGAYF